MPGAGTRLDINFIKKELGALARLTAGGFNNTVAQLKTLSTAILADVDALNTEIQAITDLEDLSDNQSIT